MVQLTQEQLDALHGAETQIAAIEAEIQKAESAGLDMSAARKQLAEVEKVRKGLLSVYGGQFRRRTIS